MSGIDDSEMDDFSLGFECGDNGCSDEATAQYEEMYGEQEKFARTKGFTGWQASTGWPIGGYIPSEGICLLRGDTGSFKSFAVLDLACCIASGNPWVDRSAGGGPVVYVATDGTNGLRKRVNGWCNAHNAGRDIDNLLAVGRPIDFKDIEKVDEFIKEIKATRGGYGAIRLVVIDTIDRCNGGDNDRYVVRACDKITAATGAAVLVVRSSKNADGSNSELNAACNSEISIKKTGNLKYELTNTKQRDSKLAPGVEVQLEVRDLGVVDEDGDTVTTLVRCSSKTIDITNSSNGSDPVYDAICDYHLARPLTSSRWFTAAELCTWHGEKPSMGTRWGKALAKLHADGKIERQELRSRRKEYLIPVKSISSTSIKEDK